MTERRQNLSTESFKAGRVYLVLFVTATAIVAFLALRVLSFAGTVAVDSYFGTRTPDPIPFEQSTWLKLGPGSTKHGMALSLARDGDLVGKNEDEVVALLGSPTEAYSTPRWIMWQVDVTLGGDYRLILHLDDDGRVASSEVRKYVF